MVILSALIFCNLPLLLVFLLCAGAYSIYLIHYYSLSALVDKFLVFIQLTLSTRGTHFQVYLSLIGYWSVSVGKYWEWSWWVGFAHSIQMWNVVWILQPVCFFRWWSRNLGHITSVTHSTPEGFVGLINSERCNRKCPVVNSNEQYLLPFFL